MSNVSQFNERFEALHPHLRAERYTRLAGVALQQYSLEDVTPMFLRHNGGVTYRLDDEAGQPLYLLKIAQPAGESGSTPPERLMVVMEWLAALATESELVVQEPVTNRYGALLTTVEVDDLSEPFTCSVQRWVEGVHLRDAFSLEQAFMVGAMIGQLHEHSSRWTCREPRQGLEQDERWLDHCLSQLHEVVRSGLLNEVGWRTVEVAADRIAETMRALGRTPKRWGAVHGDLHHQNLLFHGDSVSPIDFGDLRLAHFPYDLGVVLYHLMYLDDVAVRRAVLDGYQSVRELPDAIPFWPESFMCASALSNLSFQVTIPGERNSVHFARNVQEFANSFCRGLVTGNGFVIN